MATIEQVIADLTDFVNADIGKGTLHIESVYLALQALQEQQKRQSGCVWCKENGMVTHNGQHYELFCSYCGRRLEVEGKVSE